MAGVELDSIAQGADASRSIDGRHAGVKGKKPVVNVEMATTATMKWVQQPSTSNGTHIQKQPNPPLKGSHAKLTARERQAKKAKVVKRLQATLDKWQRSSTASSCYIL